MDTAIDYLNRVHGDLLDAAKRERTNVRSVSGRARPRIPNELVAAVVALLVAAGLIGLVVRSDGFGGGDEAAEAPAAGGATGATGAAGAAPEPATGENVVVPHGPFQSAGGGGRQDAPPPSRVIRTAEMSVVIPRDTFDDRFAEAVDVAEAQGGFVAASGSRNRSGNLTLRVPAERFGATLRALRALGTVDVESIRGQDVTAEYVDLRARIRIAKARREVLLGLLAEAASIEQTIRVQNALDQTQLDIEQLQGQLRLLNDRTALATIQLDLREEGVEPEPEVESASIPNAFERAVAGFVGVIAAVVIGLGYVLPIAILGLIGWLVGRQIQRRRS